jgi:hypothetical protein
VFYKKILLYPKRRLYPKGAAYGFIDNKTSLHYHYKCRYKILESRSMR